MTKAIILVLLLSAVYAVLPIPKGLTNIRGRGKGGKHHRRNRSSEKFEYDNVHVTPNRGIYAFNFGAASLPIKTTFSFFATTLTLLSTWDCYCRGDAFDIFDNNEYIDQTNFGNNAIPACYYYSKDPRYCYNQAVLNNEWLFAQTSLRPGPHNITYVPFLSPFGEGTAFLRVGDLCVDANNSDALVPCCQFEGVCSFKVQN